MAENKYPIHRLAVGEREFIERSEDLSSLHNMQVSIRVMVCRHKKNKKLDKDAAFRTFPEKGRDGLWLMRIA